MKVGHDIADPRPKGCARLRRHCPGDHVRCCRLHRALREHTSTAGLSRGFVLLDHLQRPRHLGRTVNIMGASLGAGFECVLAVACVRADGRDEAECFPRERPDVLVVEVADFDLWFLPEKLSAMASPCGRINREASLSPTWLDAIGIQCLTTGSDLLEFVLRTTGDRPFQIRGKVCRDVFGCQYTRIPWNKGIASE